MKNKQRREKLPASRRAVDASRAGGMFYTGRCGMRLRATAVKSDTRFADSGRNVIIREILAYNTLMQDFDAMMRKGGGAAIAEAGRFFMKTDPVHQTLRTITSRLDALAIPYAVAGGMALVAHGYERTTIDVDLLVTAEGLEALRGKLEGLGYIAPFAGSKNLRDTSTGVRIEFLISGQFPGDGKPKPVPFPDPAAVSVEIDGIRYVGLPALIELKLASGMSAPHRLKDLADVQELIKVLGLAQSFSDNLNPFVRAKFIELWDAVHNSPPEQ